MSQSLLSNGEPDYAGMGVNLKKIIECVPNFSEGRRKEVVDLLAKALTSTPGVVLLDSEMDSAHNRCVISVAGEPEAVATGVVAAVGKAVESIDLRRHQGEHPRMGAADVIPFIPISGLRLSFRFRLRDRLPRDTTSPYTCTSNPLEYRPGGIWPIFERGNSKVSAMRSAPTPSASPISGPWKFTPRPAFQRWERVFL
jgi:hypothetical protein